MEGHIDATWRIRLNSLSAVAMRSDHLLLVTSDCLYECHLVITSPLPLAEWENELSAKVL